MSNLPCFSDKVAGPTIQDLCVENGIDVKLIEDLCEITQHYSGYQRRQGIIEKFNEAIDAFLERSEGYKA